MAYQFADLMEHTVDLIGDRPALVCLDERRTFAELDARTNQLAHHLQARGFGAGDHIGIYGLNSLAWVETMVAAFKIRAVPVNINFRYVEEELRYLFGNADLKGVAFDASYASRIAAVRDDLPMLEHLLAIDDGADHADADALGAAWFEDAVAEGSPERDFGPRSADDIVMIYTGGTTGMPKGVMWRHEDIFYALAGGIDPFTREPVTDEWEQSKKAAAASGGLVFFNLPPLMHGAAFVATNMNLFQGNVSVLTPRFEPAEVWRSQRQRPGPRRRRPVPVRASLGAPHPEVVDQPIQLVALDGGALGEVPVVQRLGRAPTDDDLVARLPVVLVGRGGAVVVLLVEHESDGGRWHRGAAAGIGPGEVGVDREVDEREVGAGAREHRPGGPAERVGGHRRRPVGEGGEGLGEHDGRRHRHAEPEPTAVGGERDDGVGVGRRPRRRDGRRHGYAGARVGAHRPDSSAAPAVRTRRSSSWSFTTTPRVASTTSWSRASTPRIPRARNPSMLSDTPGGRDSPARRRRATASATSRASASATSGTRRRRMAVSRSGDGWSTQW